jgi:hypothetical protein
MARGRPVVLALVRDADGGAVRLLGRLAVTPDAIETDADTLARRQRARLTRRARGWSRPSGRARSSKRGLRAWPSRLTSSWRSRMHSTSAPVSRSRGARAARDAAGARVRGGSRARRARRHVRGSASDRGYRPVSEPLAATVKRHLRQGSPRRVSGTRDRRTPGSRVNLACLPTRGLSAACTIASALILSRS